MLSEQLYELPGCWAGQQELKKDSSKFAIVSRYTREISVTSTIKQSLTLATETDYKINRSYLNSKVLMLSKHNCAFCLQVTHLMDTV